MKKVIKIIAFVVLTYTQSCSQSNINNRNDEAIKMLTSFYTSYFTKWDNEKSLDSLKRNYLTINLYDKISEYTLSGQFDFDPLINGQDIDKNWKKTLKIRFEVSDSTYEMCTTSSFNNKQNCSFLKLRKTESGYKIYDIKVNGISSIIGTSKIGKSQFSQKWIGKYSTWLSYGKIGGDNAGWALEITITKDNIKATGDGFQMGFFDELSGVEEGNKLILSQKKTMMVIRSVKT